MAGVIVDYKGHQRGRRHQAAQRAARGRRGYFVVKNTMLRLAVKETGLAGLADVLKGSTALAVSKRTHGCRPHSEQVCRGL